jgi:hypothetical protein
MWVWYELSIQNISIYWLKCQYILSVLRCFTSFTVCFWYFIFSLTVVEFGESRTPIFHLVQRHSLRGGGLHIHIQRNICWCRGSRHR